ncbi:hypothetical protein Hdeb2414_s0020g00561161 [Helianthus debilis subsp. tardiflorus]
MKATFFRNVLFSFSPAIRNYVAYVLTNYARLKLKIVVTKCVLIAHLPCVATRRLTRSHLPLLQKQHCTINRRQGQSQPC